MGDTWETIDAWEEFSERLCAQWVSRRSLRPFASSHHRLEDALLKALDTISLQPLHSQASLIQQLESAHRLFLLCEDSENQEKAREKVPVERLHSEAQKALEDKAVLSFDEGLLKALLKWFKTEFFKWTNAPPCRVCKSPATQGIQGNQPTEEERRFLASNTEVYICTVCSAITRFPRYNDPVKLLETRQGRCGEWSNAFCLICKALGFETRKTLDVTDHTWTEVKIEGRWIACDSCEQSYDEPLMYEAGWGKKLSFVFAMASNGLSDVTPRYTQDFDSLTERRLGVHEVSLAKTLKRLTKEKRRGLPQDLIEQLEAEDQVDESELLSRLPPRQLKPGELVGRQSGSLAWRIARGEHSGKILEP